ncbi:hypothetical protein ABPG77_003689 [Micractinium sp. CCAP 211/92]
MAQSDSDGSSGKRQQADPSGGGAARRQLRPRSAQRLLVDAHPELDALLGREEEVGGSSNQRQLNVPLLCAKVERDAPAALFAGATPADDVTAAALAASGLRRPLLVRADKEGGAAAACTALGLRLPPGEQLTPGGLAAQLGAEVEVPTIDVPTQGSGPRATLAQLADYLEQREAAWHQAKQGGKSQPAKRRRQQAQQAQQQGALAGRLLNVVSLPLAGTTLEGAISPPAAVEELDLVGCVWPDESVEEQRPETLLYALMGPGGVYTDWHVDMGGSAVWYHVVSGRKVFLAAPPTPGNLRAFEEWSSSGKQASSWLGDKLSGLVRLSVGAGDTLLLPSAWPHAVSTPEPSFAVGGNFLHALDFGAIAECYRREQRLGVTPKFQFPLFRRLMWYAAEHALHRLRPCVRQGLHPGAAGMTNWELGGLPALVDLLGEWWRQQAQGGSRKAAGVPARIPEPWELLEELQDCLDTLHRRDQQQQQQQPGEQPGEQHPGEQHQEGHQQQQQQQHPLGEQREGEHQQARRPLGQHVQLAGGEGQADPAADSAADDLAVWAAMAVVGSMDASAADADGAAATAVGSPSGTPGGVGSPAGLGSPARALQHRQRQDEMLQMVPLAEAGGGGGGSGDMGLSLSFEQPSRPSRAQQAQQAQGSEGQAGKEGKQLKGRPPAVPQEAQPRQGKRSGVRGAASAATNGRRAGKLGTRGTGQQQRVADSSSSDGEPSSPSGSGESESESLEDEQLSSEEEEESMALGGKRTGGAKPRRREVQRQQPARRRLRKAGSDGAGANNAVAPAPKRRRTGTQTADGAAGSAAVDPAGVVAAVPHAPPPPADLQALGRKHTPGYTISLSRRRSNLQQQPGKDARQREQAAQPQPESQAAAAGELGQGHGELQHQDPASVGAPGRPAGRRAAAPAAAEEPTPADRQAGRQRRAAGTAGTAQPARLAPGQHGLQEKELAEKLLTELQQLQAVVRREEELLARVQAGLVSLPDGGAKLSASLEQRREALRRKTDAAEGRVLTYLDESGAVQASGPFSVPQLQKLVRAGVVGEGTLVTHPQNGGMPLAEALRLPEPLSAQLLRQREQAAQQGQAAQPQRGGLGGGMQHLKGVQRGPWRPRGRRGWEEERRRREWEEEQLRMEAEAQAMAAAAADQEESGMWCYREESSGRRELEGPYTVAELRDLHRRGAITNDILVHDEEQGVSVHLFTLLGYTDLAEVSRRQRAEAATHARAPAAEAALRGAGAAGAAAAAGGAAHAAAGQGQEAGPAGAAFSGQGAGWDGGFHGGSGGAEPRPHRLSPSGDGDGTPYEPSPAYSPPAAPQHVGSAAELYSPSRADWDDDEQAAPEEQQPAASPGPAGGTPAAAGDEAPPPPPPPPPSSAAPVQDMEIEDAPAAAAAAPAHGSTAGQPGQQAPQAGTVGSPQAPLALSAATAGTLPGPPSAPGPALPGFVGGEAPGTAAAAPWERPSASLPTGGAAAPGMFGAIAAAAGGGWAQPLPALAQQQVAGAPVPAPSFKQQPLQQQLPQPAAQLGAAQPWMEGQGSHLQAPTVQQPQQPQQGRQQQEPTGGFGGQWQGSRQSWQGEPQQQPGVPEQRWTQQQPQRWQQGRGGRRGGRWQQGGGRQGGGRLQRW